MRALLSKSLAAASLAVLAPAVAGAQQAPANNAAAKYVKILIESKPTQKGVEYESPVDANAVAACKYEDVLDAKGSKIGFALRDGQGKLLRRFVDVDGSGKLNQWSYYQDGFEVYRERDLNRDKTVDECRWMNGNGTRIARVINNKLVWIRISAEEASKILVQALATGDAELLESIMATAEDMVSLGLPREEIDRVAAGAAKRVDTLNALRSGLVGWNETTVWLRLDGAMPHVIPMDAASGLKGDVLMYENAVIFAGPPGNQGAAASKVAFLQAPEIVKVGEAWKFADLPRAINPSGNAVVAAIEGGIRSSIYKGGEAAGGDAGVPAELGAAMQKLAEFDKQNEAILGGDDKKAIAQYHVERVKFLRAIVKLSTKPDDVLLHNKQIVDSLAAAYATGLYADGAKVLQQLEAQGDKIASYAAFRRMYADFALANEAPGANIVAVTKKWHADLKDFLKTYGKSEEAPDALLQLGSSNEINAEEDEAKASYTQLATQFPDTPEGKRAAGALRRFDLVGKPLSIKGTTDAGKPLDSASFRGKTLLVTYWATWAGPVKRDLPDLAKVHKKFSPQGFEILGVNLDTRKDDLAAFLKDNPLPWPQIVDPAGMEGQLALDYGIVSLPTMFLVDAQGKVLSRSIRNAADLELQLEKIYSANTGGAEKGVALGGEKN